MTVVEDNEAQVQNSGELRPLSGYLGLSPEQRYKIVSRSFPDWLMQEPIHFPGYHPTFGWACQVEGCECAMTEKNTSPLCDGHRKDFALSGDAADLRSFIEAAIPKEAHTYGWALKRRPGCKVCGSNREAQQRGYCAVHINSLRSAERRNIPFEVWAKRPRPLDPLAPCSLTPCVHDADVSVHVEDQAHRICRSHMQGWRQFKRRFAGTSELEQWTGWRSMALADNSFKHFSDRGRVSLTALPDGLRREVRYAIYHHGENPRRTVWRPMLLSRVVAMLAESGVQTLSDPALSELADRCERGSIQRRILLDMPIAARTLIATEEISKAAGWFDPLIVGATSFIGSQTVSADRRKPWDLTRVTQRWLRDLLWEYLRDESLEPIGKRCTRATVSQRIMATTILSYTLRQIRLDNGDDLSQITGDDAKALKDLWDLWYSEKIPLPLGLKASDEPKPLTELTRYLHVASMRLLLQHSRDKKRTTRNLELFAFNLPWYNPPKKVARPRPLAADIYEQLVDPKNIALLEAADRDDVGWADIWLTQAFQGGRIGETLRLRLGCVGLVGLAQPYIWRDISKVNVVDYGMPCHLPIFERLLVRQQKTRAKLTQRFSRRLASLDDEGKADLYTRWDSEMPLFPASTRNIDLALEVSQSRFREVWTEWFESLGLQGITTHQTRATLATSLLNNGAPPELVRQLLGHFSSESLAFYARYGDQAMTRHLQQVWAAGPGMDNPGTILLTPAEVHADDDSAASARIDLAVVPVEHGLCRYGPVVGGANCPFEKNCSGGRNGPCEHFVLTGADLSYWERKRDAAYHFAEGAPTADARDYIVSQWDPWEPVLKSLRQTLNDLGLLKAAEELDLRNPIHDYFDPLFSTGWPVSQLGGTGGPSTATQNLKSGT